MVESTEENPGQPNGSGASTGSSSASGSGYRSGTSRAQNLFSYLKLRGMDTFLWLFRAATLIFGFLYIFPIGVNQAHCYQKTLLSAAASNALRLQQRLGRFEFSLVFLHRLVSEDACHYFFYSLALLGCSPVTMALMPVAIFALLHWSTFTIQMLSSIGSGSSVVCRNLVRFNQAYTQSLLQVVAFCEIFLMPLIVVMVFSGRCNLFIPIIYYRFLTLRYVSRRNPYTRIAFEQMRFSLEHTVSSPRCPAFVRTVVFNSINFLSRLAPQPTPATAE